MTDITRPTETLSPFLPGTKIQFSGSEEETYAKWLISNAKVIGECWECHLAPVPRGYCYVQVGGREGVKWRVHRLVWMIVNGPIPADKIILHTCDNRKCIRPEHLICGTEQDNTDDMISKGRKVDDPDVGHRRKLATGSLISKYLKEGFSKNEIRNKLGISNSTLWNYTNGTYKAYLTVSSRD